MPETPEKAAQEAMDASLHLLKFRRRSERELAERLGRKGFSQDLVDRTLRRLRELGLLDDQALARDWFEARRRAGEGDVRIRQKLRQRGIDRQTIDTIFTERPDLRGEEDRAWEALRKRAARFSGEDPRTLYRRLAGYLVRRGYSAEAAHRVLRRYFAQTADIKDDMTEESS
jgi:regulatory protein